ncbi:hypothetical protein HZS_3567, partial [Henneguya salminicola]
NGFTHIRKVLKFKKGGSKLFEELSMMKIDKEAHIMEFVFKNIRNSDMNIDLTGSVYNFPASNYILDGAYGVLGRIMMFMNIKYFKKINPRIYSIDKNIKSDYFYIRVLSLLWKSYQFLNGECCNLVDCRIPCPHFFKFYLNNKYHGTSDSYTSNLIDKLREYDYYFFFKSEDLWRNENFSISLIVGDAVRQDTVFDAFEIPNLSFYPNSISPKLEAVSKYGNIEIKYILGLINKILFQETRVLDKLKCRVDTCNGNGICLLNHNKIQCKCKTGFQGKYCEKWYCDKNCNQKGICQGANSCNCYPLYSGEQCEMYLVDEIFKSNDDAINCYHYNNSVKCFCAKDLLTLKYCKKIFCLNKNYFRAKEQPNIKIDSSCDCSKYLSKMKCYDHTLISDIQKKSKVLFQTFIGLFSAVSIILFLAIMMNDIKTKNLIRENFTLLTHKFGYYTLRKYIVSFSNK